MTNNGSYPTARSAAAMATGEVVTPEQYYQDSDGADWAPAINKAAAAALQAGGTLSLGKRIYTVAGHVLIQTTTDIYAGVGLRVVGLGRATKIVKTADSSYTNDQGETKKAVIVVKGFANLTLHGLTLKDDSSATDSHGVWFSGRNMTKFDIRDIYTNVGGYSLFVSGDMFINWLVNVQMEANISRPGDGVLWMDKSGTTNFIDGLFANRAKGKAYMISGFYSTLGSLAADDCAGDIYCFADFNGTIASLGCENRNVKRGANVSVLATNFAQGSIGNINIQDAHNVDSGAVLCRFINESRWDIGQLNLYTGGAAAFPAAIAACSNNTEVTFSNLYNGGVPVTGKSSVDVTSFLSGVEVMDSEGARGIAPSATSHHLPRNISKQASWTFLGTLTAPDRQPTTRITLQQGVSTRVLACDLYITFDLSSQATAFVANKGSHSAQGAFSLRRTGPLSCEIYYRVDKDFGFGSYQVQTTRGSYWRPNGATLAAPPADVLEICSDEMLSAAKLTAVQPLGNPASATTAEVAGLLNRLINALKS
ncbi:Uncharacterised protein [Serratia entomophila]|uniref:hypothetical protein n=1 Tax=Serratia entomophila TaxID=42906 RepID=UPI00217C9F3A|nr:hypothetical protein [Serratia entomophila]CAI1066507.1 Uncharacterised protein [Serratia entomophila]CAI1083814.1 Uncharacterised protein [Serratia entomophila]CAI2134522.1 Uncharacterised protein [Serratia entomophila]